MSTLRGRLAAYRISKAALNAVTRLAVGAVREWDIKVNAIAIQNLSDNDPCCLSRELMVECKQLEHSG